MASLGRQLSKTGFVNMPPVKDN